MQSLLLVYEREIEQQDIFFKVRELAFSGLFMVFTRELPGVALVNISSG